MEAEKRTWRRSRPQDAIEDDENVAALPWAVASPGRLAELSAGMRRTSGFTLLEVMVAIVLTSLVVLLAYGAAQVSYDAQARLGAELQGLQGARAMRELHQDALHNARPPQLPGHQGLTLQGIEQRVLEQFAHGSRALQRSEEHTSELQ